MNSNINLASARSSSAITGLATNSTTVYHGPDSSNYAKVGSIGPNETVNILAQSMGWYHVEYTVNGTSKRKTGYVPKFSLTSVSSSNISEEDFYGGYCYAVQQLDVRTCDVFADTASIGNLFINEGCTFLFSYLVNGVNVAFIEYATSSGTKRGYVESNKLKFTCETIVAIANEKIDVYAGPSTSYTSFGTIFQNELMAVIAKEDNLIYVEYNTTKGRKRGYVDWSQLNEEIFYYKAGKGSKHIFLVFAQHGWEDGTKVDGTLEHGDGNMLSKIAKNFMNRLASMNEAERTKILDNWTIFLFPRINPDGIKFGNTKMVLVVVFIIKLIQIDLGLAVSKYILVQETLQETLI